MVSYGHCRSSSVQKFRETLVCVTAFEQIGWTRFVTGEAWPLVKYRTYFIKVADIPAKLCLELEVLYGTTLTHFSAARRVKDRMSFIKPSVTQNSLKQTNYL